jgi:hypothetical protein
VENGTIKEGHRVLTQPDYRFEASRRSRDEFGREHPHFFLVGLLRKASEPVPTGEDDKTYSSVAPPSKWNESVTKIFAVRKVQTVFPSMITVGRTQNNDIVIADGEISRFHGYFHVLNDQLEIADAGSVHGTFLNDVRLAPSTLQVVGAGARIRFGTHEFRLLDAPGTWERLRNQH